VAAELALPNLRAEHARVEALHGRFEVITSRAFASLPDFCQWTAHLLAPGGVWMAMKGKAPAEEMAALPSRVVVRGIEPLQVPGLDDAERCIVWMHPGDAAGPP
jgi:16S rRNA (guanine527-N7)-methyltransferase